MDYYYSSSQHGSIQGGEERRGDAASFASSTPQHSSAFGNYHSQQQQQQQHHQHHQQLQHQHRPHQGALATDSESSSVHSRTNAGNYLLAQREYLNSPVSSPIRVGSFNRGDSGRGEAARQGDARMQRNSSIPPPYVSRYYDDNDYEGDAGSVGRRQNATHYGNHGFADPNARSAYATPGPHAGDAFQLRPHTGYRAFGPDSSSDSSNPAGADKESRALDSSDMFLEPNRGSSGASVAEYKARRRRRCCGGGYFCCFSKKCCCIFIPILLVILAGVGVTLYFVWPRIPDVEFTTVTVPSQRQGTVDSGNAVEQVIDSANVNRDGVVTVPLVIHLNVTNPNFIPWTIHNVTVDGFLKNSTRGGENFPIGSGGLKEPFTMPKKSVDNDMPIWFNFRLDTGNTDYLDAARIVQRACTRGGPKLRFYYEARVILKAISWLGIKPKISDTINFECPIDDIEKLGINVEDLTGLSGNLDPSEILQSINRRSVFAP